MIGSNLMESFESGQGFGYAFLEIAVLSAILIYIVFAFVIVKQVGKMTETLEVGFEAPLRFLALLHFVLSVGLLFVALVLL